MRISALSATFVASTLTGNIAQAECVKDATVEELLQAVQKGEEAFAQDDIKQLRHWAGQARGEIIPCLKIALSPKQAGAFHRLMTIEALTFFNMKRVVSEYQAVRRLDPGYQIPPAIAEGDHPLIGAWEEAATAPDGEPEALYPPQSGYLMVGGVRNAPRMSFIPIIVQVYGPGDVWKETRYFLPGETLPKWGDNPFGFTPKDFGFSTKPLWKESIPWYVTAGVLAAVSGASYLAAMDAKGDFQNPSTPDSDLPGLRDRANGFGTAAVGSGIAALVFTGVGVGFHYAFGGDDEEKPKTKPSVRVGVKR